MRKILLLPLLVLLGIGCASTTKLSQREISGLLASKNFENQFTGLFVLDAITRDTLINANGEKYFTPASNTKIFTLFASLKLLPKNIPSLKYRIHKDTLFVEGTGDPSLLHPHFKDSTAIHFLRSHKSVAFYPGTFEETRYGPGWAWGDYPWYYQVEKSVLPLYGNVVRFFHDEGLQVTPGFFKKRVSPALNDVPREEHKNLFYVGPEIKDTLEVPYRTSDSLTLELLGHSVGQKIVRAEKMPPGPKRFLYGIPTDTVLKRMMHVSDNFLAEQLLILASAMHSDTLNTEKVRNHIIDSVLTDLQQSPRWVDGSGLSRYNLFTPQSMVHVLHRMYREYPKERLFSLFPAGGVSGTLEDWYPGNPEPYIYAKTGSLGNNHCLSGYLLTKSGRTLIFSFMNNHFRLPSAEVKQRMQNVLEIFRDRY
ncbi:MAG: D-alanyl-D-alanine carboxypeptidase [Bacteroidota bacterium]